MKSVSIEIENEMEDLTNTIYYDYYFSEERHQLFFGGSSSGKSYYLAQRAVNDVYCLGRNYLIVRNVQKTLRQSTFNEIKKAITSFSLNHLFSINKTEMTITCIENGKQILFCGLDDTEKIKSITPAIGVIDTIWIEEATEIEYKAFKQLEKRLRGKSEHKKRIILSFNPILQSHWIYKEFFNQWDDTKTLLKLDDLLILKTTYKDNKFLETDDIKALENEKDPYFYNVYTLGNWGVLGALIFTNWKTADLKTLSRTFDKVKNGLDFGFAKDPSVLVRSQMDKAKKKIYVFDCFFKYGLTNPELAEELLPRIKDEVLYCDSAEPKSIQELRNNKIRAIPAIKGPDSVNFGIQYLKQYEIIIDISLQEAINEASQYKWKEDKNGNVLPIPVDKFNHFWDTLRYSYADEYMNVETEEDNVGAFEGL